MERFLKICGWVIVTINSIASIVLLFIICPRVISHENLGFDYMGVVVAIFSALVTLLVAWNIYSAIGMKKEIDTMHKYCESEIKTVSGNYNKKYKYLSDSIKKTFAMSIGDSAKMYGSLVRVFQQDTVNYRINYNFILYSVKAVVMWSDVQQFPNADSHIVFMLNKIPKPEDVVLLKVDLLCINEYFQKISNSENIPHYNDLNNFILKLKIVEPE